MHRGQYEIHHSPPSHIKNRGIITNKIVSRIPSKNKIQNMNFLPFSILCEQGISLLHAEKHMRGTAGQSQLQQGVFMALTRAS